MLSTQEEISFDKALIATGSNVRLLRVDGVQLDGIHYLRALGNADTIRADTEDAEHVVVIGGSYIATEVAASLTLLGRKVSMLMQETVTHERSFGAQAGRFFQDVLEEHGVEIHGDDALARFEGADGRVTRVVSESGLELDADAVVIGAGAIPDTMLAKQAGLEHRRARRRGAARRAWRPRSRGCSRPATSASTTRRCTAGPCASSTGTWPSTTARRRR